MNQYPEEVKRLHDYVREVKEKHKNLVIVLVSLALFLLVLGYIVGSVLVYYLIFVKGWLF